MGFSTSLQMPGVPQTPPSNLEDVPIQDLEVWSAEKGGALDASVQIQSEEQHFHISDENANF